MPGAQTASPREKGPQGPFSLGCRTAPGQCLDRANAVLNRGRFRAKNQGLAPGQWLDRANAVLDCGRCALNRDLQSPWSTRALSSAQTFSYRITQASPSQFTAKLRLDKTRAARTPYWIAGGAAQKTRALVPGQCLDRANALLNRGRCRAKQGLAIALVDEGIVQCSNILVPNYSGLAFVIHCETAPGQCPRRVNATSRCR